MESRVIPRGTWLAQSDKHATLDLRVVGSSPVLGSGLAAQSLEPALDSVSPSLSAPPLLALCLYELIKKIPVCSVVLGKPQEG